MTTRTFVDSKSGTWSWEETPEVLKALKELHETANQVNENKTNEYQTTN